jgi:hypothetical protein
LQFYIRFGRVKMIRLEALHIAHYCADPQAAACKGLEKVYKKEALKVCLIESLRHRCVPLFKEGIEAIRGKD